MDGDGFDRGDADGALDFAEAVKLELVDLAQGVGVLPVVLDDVDVVGDGEEAGEGGGFGVPEGRGYDALVILVWTKARSPESCGRHTALNEDIDALLDEQRSIEDNQAVAQRQHIVAGAHLEKGPDRTL